MKSNRSAERNLQMAQELTVLGPPGTAGTELRAEIARLPFLMPGH